MFLASFAFLLGAAALQFFTVLPSYACIVSVLVFAFFLLLLVHVLQHYFSILCHACKAFIFVLFGFGWSMLFAHTLLGWHLPESLWKRTVIVSGRIVSLPALIGQSNTFLFDIHRLNGRKITRTVRIKLHWYNKFRVLHVGDDWQLAVRLKPVHGLASDGAVDAERVAFYRHVRAKGYVIKSAKNKMQYAVWYHRPVDRLREHIQRLLIASLSGSEFLGLIMALTIGEKTHITPLQWQIFKRTGTNHLVAVSGLHVGLICSFFFVVVNQLWRRISWCVMRVPASIPSSIIGLLFAVIYSALSGFSVSTQRAIIMIGISVVLHCLYRRYSPWQVFSFALFSVLLIDPMSTLSVSFWFSFGAVGLIFYSICGYQQNKRSLFVRLLRWSKLQLFISLGLLPLSLLCFNQVSFVAVLANFIAIPWMSFFTIPLALFSVVVLLCSLRWGSVLLSITDYSLHGIWWILKGLSMLSGAVWYHVAPPWLLALATIGVLCLLLPKGYTMRWLGMVGFLPMLFYKVPFPSWGDVWLDVLDVGQGLSVVVRTHSHVLVFDAGAKFNNRFDMGQAIVLPFLHSWGIDHIDTLMISHDDNDHSGGAYTLLNHFPVARVISSAPERFPSALSYACQSGQHWHWDGVDFDVLNPLGQHKSRHKHMSKNNRSCVLRIQAGNQSILLTGDIEKAVEQSLINRGIQLSADILVAPHHGSCTSSSQLFIQAVRPRYVVFSTGFLNRFHFPCAAVVSRYQQLGARLFNTADCGTVTFRLSGYRVARVSCYRRLHRHFWGH